MTRAAIKVKKSGYDDTIFYTHYDGYPKKLLVSLIHMKNKDNYERFIKDMEKEYDILDRYPGDINFSYVIDFDKNKIFSYTYRESHLLRVDNLDMNNIELEDYG